VEGKFYLNGEIVSRKSPKDIGRLQACKLWSLDKILCPYLTQVIYICIERDSSGRTTAVKPTVVVGFVRDGCFYTREQARLAAADECYVS
jgi:hypothetical protein